MILPNLLASSAVSPESHKHEWNIILKTSVPPAKTPAKIEDVSEALVEKSLFGMTVILWQCVVCANTKQEAVLGTDEQPLDLLLEKVEQFGPQYIQKPGAIGKESVTFIVAKYQPQTVQSNLPLR